MAYRDAVRIEADVDASRRVGLGQPAATDQFSHRRGDLVNLPVLQCHGDEHVRRGTNLQSSIAVRRLSANDAKVVAILPQHHRKPPGLETAWRSAFPDPLPSLDVKAGLLLSTQAEHLVEDAQRRVHGDACGSVTAEHDLP